MGILIFRTWLPAWSCCWWVKSLQWELNIENDDYIYTLHLHPRARMPVIHQDARSTNSPPLFFQGLLRDPCFKGDSWKPKLMRWSNGAVSLESHGTKSGGEFPPPFFRSDRDLFFPPLKRGKWYYRGLRVTWFTLSRLPWGGDDFSNPEEGTGKSHWPFGARHALPFSRGDATTGLRVAAFFKTQGKLVG